MRALTLLLALAATGCTHEVEFVAVQHSTLDRIPPAEQAQVAAAQFCGASGLAPYLTRRAGTAGYVEADYLCVVPVQ